PRSPPTPARFPYTTLFRSFTDLVDNRADAVPVETLGGCTLLQLLRAAQGRQRTRHIIQQRELTRLPRPFGTLLGLDLLPALADLALVQLQGAGRGAQIAVGKHMGVAPHQLAGDAI